MKDVANVAIRDVDGGAIISVKVVAGSSREGIVGVLGDSLKIATSAAAEKGRANAAVAKTLAAAVGVGPGAVRVASGRAGARKEFLISGLSGRGVRKLLSESQGER